MEIKTRITSSLEKVFVSKDVTDYPRLEKLSALRGERIAFQLIFKSKSDVGRDWLIPSFSGELSEYVTVRRVGHVPLVQPLGDLADDNYLSTEAGIFPDILEPIRYGGNKAFASKSVLESLWIDVDIPADFSACESLLTVTLTTECGETCAIEKVLIDVIGATLPEAELYYTRWFHADCLSHYYGVPVFSKRHWRIIENFLKTAVHGGVNTILTPLVTPSLDGIRTIVQLVKIKKIGEKYSFNFNRLDKWIDMCDRVGIKYFEISHLTTQHGANGAPRIVATVDGEEKLIFSYETDSRCPEYKSFLRSLLKAFIRHMKRRGDDTRCIYHISDEPDLEHIDYYREAKTNIADIIADYKHIDALEDIDFYKNGLVGCPVPITSSAMNFIEAGVSPIWVYYCGGPAGDNYSNSFVAMPSWRTRSIGMQLYKYNIEGFLHWGYNYYYNIGSHNLINPYLDLNAERWVPAGDTFIVYPENDGTALESLRAEVFYHALEDIRAMKLCEKYYSHGEVVGAIEDVLGYELDFKGCVRSAEKMLMVRERINQMIKAKL